MKGRTSKNIPAIVIVVDAVRSLETVEVADLMEPLGTATS
jgi:hypothetical protein